MWKNKSNFGKVRRLGRENKEKLICYGYKSLEHFRLECAYQPYVEIERDRKKKPIKNKKSPMST